MGRRPKPATRQARLPAFVRVELDDFVDELKKEVKLQGNAVDVLGALVLAGRGLPPTVVRELVDIYKKEAEQHVPTKDESSSEADAE